MRKSDGGRVWRAEDEGEWEGGTARGERDRKWKDRGRRERVEKGGTKGRGGRGVEKVE